MPTTHGASPCIFGCWRSITKAFAWGIGSISKSAPFLSYPKFLWSLPFQCTSCHRTHYHTAPYKFSDAERLLLRIREPANQAGYVSLALRPPTPPPPPPASQTGRIDCANIACYTKNRKRTQGSQTCIEFKCKACCVHAALQATDGGQGRARCNAHGQDAVAEVARAVLPQIDPNLDQQREDVSTYDSDINRDSQVITTNTVPTPFPPLSPLQPRQPTPTSAPLQPTITSQPTESTLDPLIIRRSLAQPLDAEWASHRQAAQDERATIRTRKIQQHEMDERKKRTCLLVVYHTVSLSLSEPCFYRKISYFKSPEWFTTSTD